MNQINQSDSRRLGDFEIVREIGRGGMGVVYEARQVSLNRKVALKVLSGGLGLTPKAVQRFRREAEAAAKLHHTNIVPVYATGEEGGTHFYGMELIEGPSLDHVIRQMRAAATAGPGATASRDGSNISPDLGQTGPYVEGANISGATSGLSSSSLGSGSGYFDTVARMIAEVADALEYAHQQGVIHRDMKPSNLLLSPAERLSVNDFGLARMLEQPGMTMTGEFVGTPAYMSPEQITAGRAPLDHRTDIYSLGATLYELLTLQRPFLGERRDEVIAQIMHKEPKSPRRINRKVPLDLETICLKAMEKDPDRRYQTAGAMAEDLRRYVNRFAILARRAGPVQRLVKWVKRQPAVAASLGCVLIAFCIMLGFAYQAHRARLRLLDEKISKAYMVAAGGDLRSTEEAIKEIEDLGASTGHVRLLRGMVSHFRGDTASAISELEQAVKLLPESVSARALLAASYGNNGQFGLQGQVLKELEKLTPTTPEDYLFMGYAQGEIANLNKGIGLRDSALGRALRTWVRSGGVHDTGDRQELELLLADADAARAMSPDNARVLCYSAWAHLIAAGIYQEAKLPDKQKAELARAERDVKALETFVDDLPTVVWPAWWYYEEINESDKALNVAQRMFKASGSPLAANYCVIDLYHLGRFDDALGCIDHRRQPDLLGDILRPFVLVELADNGPRRALEEYEKATRDRPGDLLEEWKELLLLLGEKEQVLAIIQKLNRTHEAEWEFYQGKLSEDEYLAKAGASHIQKTGAHYHIGMLRLATGDREGARKHFEKIRGNRTCCSTPFLFSQMFLSRMKKDPDWPKRIQLKKDQPKQ
jgi:serine/threonine protein kinase